MQFNLMKKSALLLATLGLITPLALSGNASAKKTEKPFFKTVKIHFTNKKVNEEYYFGANSKGQYQRGYNYRVRPGDVFTTNDGHHIGTWKLRKQLFKITQIKELTHSVAGAIVYYMTSRNHKYIGYVDGASVYNQNILHGVTKQDQYQDKSSALADKVFDHVYKTHKLTKFDKKELKLARRIALKVSNKGNRDAILADIHDAAKGM
ncbi:hypothetical protein WR164_15590 [Philodulcilactobacillus myokoensis]|uniref:Surface layer protein A domain-containing protein n=1 Tax=Philodulcilactobacillus myokoensis TaxID=2929573 RepID=A0A9W6B3X0_9LACO|nr:hypothetical protein [Philodulcilactobacillus myokoensis]GLB47580.1 hypothetical protein WR164_15590 [Philodulcilactobacillus myokoensis]